MRKIFMLLAAAVIITSINVGVAAAENNPVKIGLVQLVEHTSLDTIRESFIKRLKELNYDSDKVVIDYQNAHGKRENVADICKKFVSGKVDMIAAIATPAAQGAAAATGEIPIIFLAVSDPLKAGLLENMEAPEGNITGTSDVIPVDSIFELAAALTPEAKNFGFLYNGNEVNSLTAIGKAKEYCDAHGLSYVEELVANADEIQGAVRSLAGKADAIFCPNDNTVASSMPVVSQIASEAKIPVYVGAVTMVIDGGLASVGVDSAEMGLLGANLAAEVLSGKKISELPVIVVKKYNLVVNKKTADAIGVDVTGYRSVN